MMVFIVLVAGDCKIVWTDIVAYLSHDFNTNLEIPFACFHVWVFIKPIKNIFRFGRGVFMLQLGVAMVVFCHVQILSFHIRV